MKIKSKITISEESNITMELMTFEGEEITESGKVKCVRTALKSKIDKCSCGIIKVNGKVKLIFYRGYNDKIIWEDMDSNIQESLF